LLRLGTACHPQIRVVVAIVSAKLTPEIASCLLAFRRHRGPPSSSMSVLNAGGILGVSRRSSRALQSGHGMPGAPPLQAPGYSGVQQIEGRSLCRSQAQNVSSQRVHTLVRISNDLVAGATAVHANITCHRAVSVPSASTQRNASAARPPRHWPSPAGFCRPTGYNV
jgi:hypothetical protein